MYALTSEQQNLSRRQLAVVLCVREDLVAGPGRASGAAMRNLPGGQSRALSGQQFPVLAHQVSRRTVSAGYHPMSTGDPYAKYTPDD